MASIRKEIIIAASLEVAWDALRDFGAPHTRLVPGFVVDTQLDGDDTRAVTFFNGMTIREVLVGVDEEARRLVYTAVEGPMEATHHSASAQVFAGDDGGTRFVWITDVLPDELAPPINELMELGAAAMKDALSRG